MCGLRKVGLTSSLDFNCSLEKDFLFDSHPQQSGHHGAKAIKHVAIDKIQEVVQEWGDCENQRELFILSPAVCKKKKQAGSDRWNTFV